MFDFSKISISLEEVFVSIAVLTGGGIVAMFSAYRDIMKNESKK